MLIVFSGLPGVGKTTLSQAFIQKHHYCYIRVDEIEFAIQQSAYAPQQIGAVGYEVAFALALSNLKLGNTVVADNVNPVSESRLKWQHVAAQAQVNLIEIEVICSDLAEHQRRIETRISDIKNFRLPNWHAVQQHDYQVRSEPRCIIDTALLTPEQAVASIEIYIATFQSAIEQS